MTQSNIRLRREALIGTDHYVQFYGSWYCINFESGRASRAKNQEHAVTMAECKNAEVAA